MLSTCVRVYPLNETSIYADGVPFRWISIAYLLSMLTLRPHSVHHGTNTLKACVIHVVISVMKSRLQSKLT